MVSLFAVSLPAAVAGTFWWTARRCGADPAGLLHRRPAPPDDGPPPDVQLPSWFLLDRAQDPALDPAACFSCRGAGFWRRPCRRCLGTGLS